LSHVYTFLSLLLIYKQYITKTDKLQIYISCHTNILYNYSEFGFSRNYYIKTFRRCQIIELIVELLDKTHEDVILKLGTIKYALPLINSYVIEVPECDVAHLRGMVGIKSVHQNAHITAQMDVARKRVGVNAAKRRNLTGRGISIAILDTGIAPLEDFYTAGRCRIVAFKDFVEGKEQPYDDNGHGTHVAGIACGNGASSGGRYAGIATESNIVAVKVLDKDGGGGSSSVLAGLQWIADNKDKYNIRVVNLSIGTKDLGDYDPLVKAVEAAWDLGLIITIAAGNDGPDYGSITSPGISRKAVTVGSSDDDKPVEIWGTPLVNFSGRGPTSGCIVKPDIVAPGTDIISCLAPAQKRKTEQPSKIVGGRFLKLSGTSMSTPIVSGAIAILLQKHPNLTPDDVKYMLKKTATNLGQDQNKQGFGILNIEKLILEDEMHVR